MQGPISVGGHMPHPASSPQPNGPGHGSRDPRGLLRERRWSLVLLWVAIAFLIADVLLSFVFPVIAEHLVTTEVAAFIYVMVSLAGTAALLVTALATVVCAIVVMVKERGRAQIAAVVLLISSLLGTVLSFDVSSTSENPSDLALNAARIAEIIGTVVGIAQAIGVLIGIVLLVMALHADRTQRRALSGHP